MVQKSSLLAELDVVIAPSRTTAVMARPNQTATTTDTGSTIWCGTDVTTTMTTFTQTIITM